MHKGIRIVLFILVSSFLYRCEDTQKQAQKRSIIADTSQTVPKIETSFKPYQITDSSKIQTYPSGLKIYFVEKGTGNVPKRGDMVLVHYHGMLEDGSVFDSSFEKGTPFSFQVGFGRVIAGWDEAFLKLPVGTKAILIVPPDLGYGERGAGSRIPPNATLIFHVELLGVSQQ